MFAEAANECWWNTSSCCLEFLAPHVSLSPPLLSPLAEKVIARLFVFLYYCLFVLVFQYGFYSVFLLALLCIINVDQQLD